MASDSKFAVLIDADNISGKYIKIILDEISNDGIATYKRIYGDWTSPALVSWKNVLLDNSILPIQQYSYTTGKNSTDSAMIIDAMDILYSGQVDGFCIVSSDSDFTRLAARLRESGMTVDGHGGAQDPQIVHLRLQPVQIPRHPRDRRAEGTGKTRPAGKAQAAAQAGEGPARSQAGAEARAQAGTGARAPSPALSRRKSR